MKIVTYTLVLGILTIFSCSAPTTKEREIVRKLNDQYPEYHFSYVEDYLGVRLKMNLTRSIWDSAALKTTYDSTIGAYKDSEQTAWVYLTVYDKSDKYLFTIVKDNVDGNHIFFLE